MKIMNYQLLIGLLVGFVGSGVFFFAFQRDMKLIKHDQSLELALKLKELENDQKHVLEKLEQQLVRLSQQEVVPSVVAKGHEKKKESRKDCEDKSPECNVSRLLTSKIRGAITKAGLEKCRHVCYSAVFDDVDESSAFPEKLHDESYCAVLITNTLRRAPNWTVVVLDELPCSDHQRSARAMKTLSHLWFPLAESWWWIDGKIELHSTPWNVWNTVKQKEEYDMITLSHFARSTTDEEIKAVSDHKLEYEKTLKRWKEYRERNPHHEARLPDTCILLRNRNAKTIAFNELWWSFIKRYSRRDQLSFSRAVALVQDLEKRTHLFPYFETRKKFGTGRKHNHNKGRVLCNSKSE